MSTSKGVFFIVFIIIMAGLFDNLKYFAKGVQSSFAPPKLNVPTNIVARPQTPVQKSLAQQPRQAVSSAQIRTAPVVAGVSASNPTLLGGGNTGGGNTGGGNQSQDNSQQYEEQAPQPPQIDFDALIQPALDALSQAEGAVNASGEADISAIESGATTQKGSLGTAKTSAERDVASRQATTQSAGESAINESRRAAAELQQGLASKYGASSSTGLGASAIVGAQSARVIGQQRAQLTLALNEVENAKTGIIETYNNAIKEVDNTTATLKAQARSTLQTNLAQIGQSRATLQSKKAELVYNAMETYRQEVNAVNQRNTAFKQTLYTQQQAANARLVEIETQAKNKLNSVPQPNFQLKTNELTGEILGGYNPQTNTLSPVNQGSISTKKTDTPLAGAGLGSLETLAQDENFWNSGNTGIR